MGWFWLSFADPDRPKGQQFLGVCIIEADTINNAIPRAWALGCNPGGEVEVYNIGMHRVPPSKLS